MPFAIFGAVMLFHQNKVLKSDLFSKLSDRATDKLKKLELTHRKLVIVTNIFIKNRRSRGYGCIESEDIRTLEDFNIMILDMKLEGYTIQHEESIDDIVRNISLIRDFVNSITTSSNILSVDGPGLSVVFRVEDTARYQEISEAMLQSLVNLYVPISDDIRKCRSDLLKYEGLV